MSDIIARKKEVEVLERLFSSQRAEFLAIYGRMRLGKTFLVRQFFRKKGIYFELTGLKSGSLQQQLRNFSIEFSRVFQRKHESAPADWTEAFLLLKEAMDALSTKERIILFFDELPWLASPKSGFLNVLDYFWNRHFSDDNRIILIVCGSAASWMIDKIIQNKGGFHGRLTAEMRLLPFNLIDTELFLSTRRVALDRKQLVDMYMTIGGVAKYLNYVQGDDTSLHQLCCNGPLFKEFEELYSSLFHNHERHLRIVQALASEKKGLTKSEISRLTQLSMGGGLNIILNELEASGFIVSLLPFGKKKKDTYYRLIDEYSLFYLQWIEQAKSVALSGVDETFWIKMARSSSGRAWAGYAFETLVMKQIKQVKHALGISGVSTYEGQWRYRPSAGSGESGAQIDLLIDRADNCINLCEIKYANEPFILSKKYAEELREKRNIFMEKTGTKKSVFLTFISPYGIKNKEASFGTVDVELTLDALF